MASKRTDTAIDLHIGSDQVSDLVAANLEFRAPAIKRSPWYVEA